MKALPLPSVEVLNEWFNYDPTTGILTWKKRKHKGPLAGEEAGNLDPSGYKRIQFNGQKYGIHRFAWRMVTGEDPGEFEIDHKDTNRSNNRFDNLRLATDNHNQMNQKKPKSNKSGAKGVCWHKGKQAWIAHVGLNKKLIHLGYFRTVEDAEKVVREYREKLHKEFCNHG